MDDFVAPDMIVQFGVPPGRIDLLTSIESVEFDDAWAARLTVIMDDIAVSVIGRDRLHRNKRAVGRPPDLANADRLSKQPPLA